jgi:hypothetical protein
MTNKFNPNYKDSGVGMLTKKIGDEMANKKYSILEFKRSKTQLIAKLSGWSGLIPTGTVIRGCKTETCMLGGGDEHVGMVGHMTNVVSRGPDDYISATYWIWHNNWLRNADRSIDIGNGFGKIGQYMIDKRMFDSKMIERRWMATPWITVTKNQSGAITDVKSLLPQLDDMDPLGEFWVSLYLPEEIRSQLGSAKKISKA